MCGRYATTLTSASLNIEFEIDVANSFAELEPDYPPPDYPAPDYPAPDYNVAPTKMAPIVVQRRAKDDVPEHRELMLARWGLIPSWAKDPSIGSRMINARAETVAEKPSFRKAFATRRALVPADGYYEWYAGQGTPQNRTGKQPFYITPRDRSVMAMAGLYEFWKDPGTEQWVISFTILTTTAEDTLGHLHDRMPLIVERDGYAEWLDPAPHPVGELMRLLIPAAPGRLDAFPVSKAVGDFRNNGPELIRPLPVQ
ncbi:MAG: SOS response-associated peptidase [Kineosporiaceae bacterium]|nr:SOS response-associated peptidase [Aeromicrobium sp.]